MKKLILLTLITFNCYGSDLEIYNLNKETFTEKEISNDPSLCKLQNELATRLNKDTINCFRKTESIHEINDKKVEDLLKTSSFMENIHKQEMDLVFDYKR